MLYSRTDVLQTRSVEEAATLVATLQARRTEIDKEHAGTAFPDDAREEFAALGDLIDEARARRAEFEMRRAALEEAATDERSIERAGTDSRVRHPGARSNLPENLFDVDEYRARTMGEPEAHRQLLVDGARKVVDALTFPQDNVNEQATKARLHRLLASIDDPAALARHIIGGSNPLYARAFARALSGQALTGQMQAAIAVIGTTSTGGYAVPVVTDPTLILTSDGAVNPFRQVCRVETITGNVWHGLSSAGISVSRGAEAAAVTEGSPTFAQPTVTVRAVKAEIDFSIESDEDWPRLQADMARVLQDAKDVEELESFTNGNGTPPNIEGIIYTLDGSSLVGTGGDGFSLDDLSRLTSRLGDRFEPRARFMAHRAVFDAIEDLERALGTGVTYRPLAQGEPPNLKGYPRHNNSAMSRDYVTGGEDILLFGDFNYFIIVDRVGLGIEVDPHVRDGNGKWTGQRALLAHWRNGTTIIADNAFRLLRVGVVTS